MALDKATLRSSIKAALKAEQTSTNADESLERIATKLTNAIDVFVRSGVVNTTGSATAQTGKIT